MKELRQIPKSIYLVLDMLNDLVHPEGPGGDAPFGKQAASRDMVHRTEIALEKVLGAGIAVGYVRLGYSRDYCEWSPRSPMFSRVANAGMFRLGSWGTEVHPQLAPHPEDFDIVKHRASPFYGTKLELLLRGHGVERIICSGISTNAVVQAAVREANDRDFETLVLEDCCCASSSEEHEQAIAGLRRFASIFTTESLPLKA